MVNRQKQKGTRREYEMRDWFKELGLRCKRVILSGALGGDLSGDLHLFLPKQIHLEEDCLEQLLNLINYLMNC